MRYIYTKKKEDDEMYQALGEIFHYTNSANRFDVEIARRLRLGPTFRRVRQPHSKATRERWSDMRRLWERKVLADVKDGDGGGGDDGGVDEASDAM